MPRHYRELISKVTARCRLPLLHWILSNRCQGMASVRGISRGSHQAHHLCLAFKKKHLPPAMALHRDSRSHGRWRSRPWSRQGWPLCREPLSQKRGMHPFPRVLVVRARPPSFHGHQVLRSRLAWDPTLPRPWPAPHAHQALAGITATQLPLGTHPYPCWQGQGSQLAFPVFQPPSPTAGTLSRLGWSPLEYASQDRRSWTSVAAGPTAGRWQQARKTILLSQTFLQYLCCTRAVGS